MAAQQPVSRPQTDIGKAYALIHKARADTEMAPEKKLAMYTEALDKIFADDSATGASMHKQTMKYHEEACRLWFQIQEKKTQASSSSGKRTENYEESSSSKRTRFKYEKW